VVVAITDKVSLICGAIFGGIILLSAFGVNL
jgi:hypothetical protein